MLNTLVIRNEGKVVKITITQKNLMKHMIQHIGKYKIA